MQNVPVGKDFKSVQNYKKKHFFKCAGGKKFQKCASVPELSITHYLLSVHTILILLSRCDN